MASVWATLPDEVRDELGRSHSMVLAFRWYSARAIHSLMDAILKGHSVSEREHLAREGARVVISRTLKGLYRAIFQTLVSPDRYLRNTNRVWKAFHDTGRVEGRAVGPGHHRTVLYEWYGHHPFIEQLNTFAAKLIYEALGCESVRVETGQVEDEHGRPAYTLDVFWSP
jgi:hypothetical protein